METVPFSSPLMTSLNPTARLCFIIGRYSASSAFIASMVFSADKYAIRVSKGDLNTSLNKCALEVPVERFFNLRAVLLFFETTLTSLADLSILSENLGMCPIPFRNRTGSEVIRNLIGSEAFRWRESGSARSAL